MVTKKQMEQTGFVVTDREGHEQPLDLLTLPFYDPDKRIPRGRAGNSEMD